MCCNLLNGSNPADGCSNANGLTGRSQQQHDLPRRKNAAPQTYAVNEAATQAYHHAWTEQRSYTNAWNFEFSKIIVIVTPDEKINGPTVPQEMTDAPGTNIPSESSDRHYHSCTFTVELDKEKISVQSNPSPSNGDDSTLVVQGKEDANCRKTDVLPSVDVIEERQESNRVTSGQDDVDKGGAICHEDGMEYELDTKVGDKKFKLPRFFLRDFIEAYVPPVAIYTLHSADRTSEQDFVRNLMALQPEEREQLMRSEAERLRTFGSGLWPIREIMPPEELAAAGFYYTGVHDRVQCAFCRGVLRNWERGDSAMNEHRVHFSYCRLVMGLECGNVPIGQGRPAGGMITGQPFSSGTSLFASAGRPSGDITDNHFGNRPLNLVDGDRYFSVGGSGEPLPGVSTSKPKHPEYAVEARRLQTFSSWPMWALQSPENLAKAGFFYAGFGDNVKCFYCDGGLRNWEITDSPWEEHARWFEKCKYLLDVKGLPYVDEIRQKYTSGSDVEPVPQLPPRAAPSAVEHSEESFGYRTASGSPGSSLEHHPSLQLVQSLGYSSDQIESALKRFFPQAYSGTMPKGAELLEAVLRMEDEGINGGSSSLNPADSGVASHGQPVPSATVTVPVAVAASKPAALANVTQSSMVPAPAGALIRAASAAAATKPTAMVPTRPLAPLHDIIFNGLLDIADPEQRIIEENRQMRKHLECKKCSQRQAEIVLLPCGHFGSCLECVPSLGTCPACNTLVRGTIRTYIC